MNLRQHALFQHFTRGIAIATCTMTAACTNLSDITSFSLMPDTPKDVSMAEAEAGLDVSAPVPRTEAVVAKATVDVPKPDVFEVTEVAVWDGRPSVGDVWVAVPDAFQPERVKITNEDTGMSIRGAMFVRQQTPDLEAPIKLSEGAAMALGLAPNQPAMLTVTALRRNTPEAPASAEVQVARRATSPALPPVEAPMIPSFAEIGLDAPAVEPEQIDGDYVQVAEAIDLAAAARLQEHLQAAEIPAEIQEDLIGGAPYYRIFADGNVEASQLAGALEAIRFTSEAEGSDDGTLIAELPNFDGLNAPEIDRRPVWMETGRFLSRNEALSVVQRLNRRNVPAIVCDEPTGPLMRVHRVFAGPSDDTDLLDATAFCAGVSAAGEALPPALQPTAIAAPLDVPEEMLPELGFTSASLSPVPPADTGPVRIKVGEATGGLKLSVPEPFTDPIRMTVNGVGISLPQGTQPARIKAIIAAIEALD